MIQTKYFGEMKIDEQDIIHFAEGIPGFPNENEFIIINMKDNELMQVLQSVKHTDLAFIITNPHYFYADYEFELADSVIETLQIESEKDVVIYCILTVKSPFETSTINLKAPLIIHAHKKVGKQFIMNDDTYSLQASISPKKLQQEKGV